MTLTPNVTDMTTTPSLLTRLCLRKRLSTIAFGAATCLLVASPGCDGDDPQETSGSATEGDTDDLPGAECDPLGANPEVGALLNAPVEADVEVITKVPTHPGEPGPLNLP